MTPRDIGFFVAVVCVSVLIGTLLGVVCRGRPTSSIICCVVASILLFVIFEWRFGSPEEWSPQEPFASAAYMIGPFVILICAPMILAALFIGRWWMRRKVI
jgi:hypothetical protein